ncbi:MAG: YceI family protein [Actinomycetota bacterium]|nr:YceI family protein [Actinomycetota bacterium]
MSLEDLTPGTWTVDPAHSEVGFTARHMMVTKVRGTFADVAAEVVVGRPIETSTVTAEVQMASVNTRNADRDTHLRSPDFFHVESFPTMTFRSTEVTGSPMTGELTIKDETRTVTFDLEFNGISDDPWGGVRAGVEARTEVNRKDFGLTWNVAVESGGVLVGERVQLTLDIELVQPTS